MSANSEDLAALDAAQVRRAFARAAPGYDAAAGVCREIGERLLEHLEPVRIEPRRILDLGCGTGHGARALARRWRRAEVVSLDPAPPMLAAARRAAPRWRSRHRFVCADATALPLAPGTFDLVHSNLALEWTGRPERALAAAAAALRPGGLLALSTLGPDTLRELREAWTAADDAPRVHAFVDMHDLGDAIVRAGLRDVVMDTHRITVRYRAPEALMRELKTLGATNASARRRRTLTARARLRAACDAYARLRDATDGRVPATCEAVFAHAWAPAHGPASVSVALDPPPPR